MLSLRSCHYAAPAVLLLALLLHATPSDAVRKMPQAQKSGDEASSPAKEGSWPDAPLALLSEVSPVRQVAASKAHTTETPSPLGANRKGGRAMSDYEDSELFDEDSPPGLVNPRDFTARLTAPSDDHRAVEEVADEDLFDEDTPEVPIYTAVDPGQFFEHANRKDKEEKQEPSGASKARRPGKGASATDVEVRQKHEAAAGASSAPTSELRAAGGSQANTKLASSSPSSPVHKKSQKHEAAAGASSAPTSEARAAGASQAKMKSASSSPSSPVRNKSQKSARGDAKAHGLVRAPIEAANDAFSPTTADAYHAKKGHGRKSPTAVASRDKSPLRPSSSAASAESNASIDVTGMLLTEIVKRVSLLPSDCVPEHTVILVQVSHHHIPLFQAQVKNVIQLRCFMRRYVLLALDSRSMDECRKIQADGVELFCARNVRQYTGGGEGGGIDGALSFEQTKDILFDRWTVVADILEATPDLKLWVFDADVVIFKIPAFELTAGCDLSTQMDKLDALGAADVDYAAVMHEASGGGGGGGSKGAAAAESDVSTRGGSAASRHRRRLASSGDGDGDSDGASPFATPSLVPHEDLKRYSMNGGQVVLHSTPAVVAFLRSLGNLGETSGQMNQMMLRAAGTPWESLTTCDLPESFSSACWGLALDPFTFHANCVTTAEGKLKQMHAALGLVTPALSPSTAKVVNPKPQTLSSTHEP